jgi:MFS family permease
VTEPNETRPSPLALALALTPGTLLAGMAGGIAFPILPIVGLRVGLSLPFIGVILAANRAVRVVASPFVGALADRFGGRRTMLAGLVVTALVMSLYVAGILLHHAGPFFLAGRMLHGIGSAGVFIAAQTLALQAGGATQGGKTAGSVRAAMVLGVPIGLTAGGLLSDAFGEVATFSIAAGAVVVAFGGALFTVPDLRVHVKRRPPIRESLREMRDPRLFSVGALSFALNFAATGMVLTTLALLIHVRHISIFGRDEQGTAGIAMGWMTIVDAAATPFAGRLGDRFRAHARVAAGATLSVIAGLVVVGTTAHGAGLAAGLALIGLGAAGLGPSLLVVMGEIVSPGRHGTAVGLLGLMSDVGGTLGPLVGTAIFGGGRAYLVAAGLLCLFLPFAAYLSLREVRGWTSEPAADSTRETS